MDMAGLNQAHKELVKYDIQTIPHFVLNVMDIFDDKKHYPFNKSVTFFDRAKTNTAFLLLALVTSIFIDTMINQKPFVLRFISPVFSMLSSMLILELRSSYQEKR